MEYSSKTWFNIFVVAGLFLAAVTLGAATFLGAQVSQVRATIQQETPGSQAAADALDRFQARLGAAGFLFHFGEFARHAQPESLAAMRRQMTGAESALKEFESLSIRPMDAALAQNLRENVVIFKDALKAAESLQAPPASDFVAARGMVLANAYAAMTSAITAYQQDLVVARVEKLSALASMSQVTALGVAVLLAVGVAFVLLFIRIKLVHPLSEMEHSLFGRSQDGHKATLWGMDRSDEWGRLARSIDQIRNESKKSLKSTDVRSDSENLMSLDGRYAPLFEKAVNTVNQAAEALTSKAEGVQQWVQSAQAQLTSAVAHVGDTCSGVAQTSDDTQKVLFAAAEVMLDVMERLKESGFNVSSKLETVTSRLQGQADSINTQTTSIARAGVALEESLEIIKGIADGLAHSEQRLRGAVIGMDEAAHRTDEVSEKFVKVLEVLPPMEAFPATPNSSAFLPQPQGDDDIRRALSDAVAILAAKLQSVMNQLNDLRLSQIRAGTGGATMVPSPPTPANVASGTYPASWPTPAQG